MTLLLGGLCIAFAPIFVRLSELPPIATAFYRMLFALPLFGLLLINEKPAVWRTAPGLDRNHRTWLMASGLLFAADLSAWHWSLAYTSVANATLLGNFAPIFVTLAAWILFRERITWQFVWGMMLALAGAVSLMWSSLDFGTDHLFGDFLGLVTAVFYAGYMIAIKQLRSSMSTPTLMAYSTLITCAALLLITLLTRETFTPLSAHGWFALLGLAWISQFFGQGLIAYALAHLPASFSSVTLLIQPVAAAILAWLILNEDLTYWQGIGGLSVLAGIILSRRASQ